MLTTQQKISNRVNKYYIILIILAVLIGGGIGFKYFAKSALVCPTEGKKINEIAMRVLKNQWTFVPNPVEAERCDKVILKIFNEDVYDHGFAVDAFGINKRLSPQSTTEITFVATQKGTFPFYCSVPCGSGIVNGINRGHLDQNGKIIVK